MHACPDDLLCTEEVLGYLFSLHTAKANGPNGISASSLTKLFNTSIKLGEVPAEWKHALVAPVPKSSYVSTLNNYHPIIIITVHNK